VVQQTWQHVCWRANGSSSPMMVRPWQRQKPRAMAVHPYVPLTVLPC
jgi:hypothetical protein